MDRDHDGSGGRRLRLITLHGHVDGQVRVNPRISTLHYLNVTARSQSFIVMAPPIEPSAEWNVVDGSLALAFDSVIFVQEMSDFRLVDSDRAAAALYKRGAVRLNVGEYAVEGFIHMPPGGNPIGHLNQDRHPFFALTAVSVMGPHNQFAAPFLAIKRSEVIVLQAVGTDAALEESVDVEVLTTC
jgi:hypothetical protein